MSQWQLVYNYVSWSSATRRYVCIVVTHGSKETCIQYTATFPCEQTRFSRAMLRAQLCHSKLSVCPSVCLPVCDVQVCFSYRLEYFNNNFTTHSLKVLARADPNGNTSKFVWNRRGGQSLSRKPAISLNRGKIGQRLL